MPDENHSGCKSGSSEGARETGMVEAKHSLSKRDGRTLVNKIGQTDRSSGRKRHLKFLIGDNRDNDQEKQITVIFSRNHDHFSA